MPMSRILRGKVILLEDELAEERQPRETPEREHQERFEELTLLQTRGPELCHAIIGPPRVRHMSKGMRLVPLRHTEIAGELAVFWVAMSSAVESVLRCLPSNTAYAEVVDELAVEF
jgi:hypothetical protein